MKIKTKRLILRAPTLADAADIAMNANDIEVLRYTAHVPFPYSLQDARNFITFCQKRALKKPCTDLDFIVELKSEKRAIGCAGFIRIDYFTGKADIGYWFGKKYWRQGFGSEAVKALINFGFKKLKLQRLEAAIYTENLASQSLVKKLRFKKEGVRHRASRSKATGHLHDVGIWALLKPGKFK